MPPATEFSASTASVTGISTRGSSTRNTVAVSAAKTTMRSVDVRR